MGSPEDKGGSNNQCMKAGCGTSKIGDGCGFGHVDRLILPRLELSVKV